MNNGQFVPPHLAQTHALAPNTEGMPKKNDMLGNCRIIDTLGQGSMGVVYRAFDIDLEVERALKVLRPGKPDFIRRKFEAEAKISARLVHPNIVSVHASGVWQDLPFIQMELIRGFSVRDIMVAKPRFHPSVSLSIISVVAGALDYAHSQSFSIWGTTAQELVHCDLKPENFLVAKGIGILKVSDFGLAHFEKELGTTSWGTPEYMSPEQHANAKIDCRSDIYSLGIILYEMICGVRPFPNDDEDQMVSLKQQGTYATVAHHHSSVPASICEIIDKCLQPNVDKRYSNHESLKYSIDSALADMSPRPAHDIVKSFFDAPDKFVPIARIPTKKKPGIPIVPLIVAGSVLLLAIVIIAYRATLTTPKPTNTTPVSLIETKPSSAPPVAHPETVFVAKPESQQSLSIESPRTQPSQLQAALAAYAAKNFTAVISEINGIDMSQLKSSTRDSALIVLAEAYYMTGSLRDLVDMNKKSEVNDSRFFLLLGLSYAIFNDFAQAAEYFDKAIVAPSKFFKSSRGKLLFQRAEFYKRYYESSTNAAIKSLMINAYQLFIQESCKSASPQCDSAAQIIKKYE